MVGEKDQDESKNKITTRRNLLRATGSSLALGWLSSPVQGRDTVRVPKYKNANGVIEWREVPRKWDNHINHVLRVVSSFKEKFLDVKGVKSIGLTKSAKTYGGKTGLTIVVEHDSSQITRSFLPNKYDGYEVQVKEWKGGELLGCDNWENFDPTPGGVWVLSDNGTRGTTGYHVKDTSNGERYMLTAAHLWGYGQNDACPLAENGDVAKRWDGKYGEVRKTVDNEDWTLFDNSLSTVNFEQKIKPENDTRYYVRGYVSEKEMANLAGGSDVATYKMGCTTGFTSGDVSEMNVSDGHTSCIDYGGSGVRVATKGAGGDSGGPVFVLEGSDAHLVCPVSAGVGDVISSSDCASSYVYNQIKGTASYHIDNQHNIAPVEY